LTRDCRPVIPSVATPATILGLGGADAQSTSIGHRWQHGGRNAPTVLHAVFNTAQFWDGRAKDLEQAAGQRTFVIILEPGEEAFSTISDFAVKEQFSAGDKL
jgi:cytochrome c peroxidase